MKLGLLTAAFPDLTLDEVAAWAAGEGFETLEVACWPAAGGEQRRYAGVSHIDVTAFDPDEVRGTLERHGLEISALAYYPNNLHPDDAHREELMRTEFNGRGKVEIGRFKGLGEMLPAQLKETTMDPSKRTLLKVAIDDVDFEGTRTAVDDLMGTKPEARFRFIQERAVFADNLDS